MVGGNVISLEFGTYTDSVSLQNDSAGDFIGITTCGTREFYISEVELDPLGLVIVRHEIVPFMTLEATETPEFQRVTLSSASLADAGVHFIEVTGMLSEYKDLLDYQPNQNGIIEASMHLLVSDMTILDVEYQLFSAEVVITLPEPLFQPPLLPSEGPNGVSGSEFVI